MQLAEGSLDRQGCQSIAWRIKRGHILLLHCWHALPGSSKQAGQCLDDHVPSQTTQGRHCLPGTLATILRAKRAQHVQSGSAQLSTAQHRYVHALRSLEPAQPRHRGQQAAAGGHTCKTARVYERQWDGSGSWICAGTLPLASPHWHTFVLGKCPTGMFQGDAALHVRTAPAHLSCSVACPTKPRLEVRPSGSVQH